MDVVCRGQHWLSTDSAGLGQLSPGLHEVREHDLFMSEYIWKLCVESQGYPLAFGWDTYETCGIS